MASGTSINEPLWIGLDLGLRSSRICVVDDSGAPLHDGQCETSRLSEALAEFPVERIALVAVEAAPDTYLIRKLRAQGFPVAMFETRKASKFLTIRRNKTDAGDARGLADLARLGQHTVSQVHLKSPECEQLHNALVLRKKLVVMRVAMEGVLRSRMARYGQTFKASQTAGAIRQQVESALAGLGVDEEAGSDLAPLVDLCESLRAYLARLDSDFEDRANSHDVCRLLMEVPGVGPFTALTFYSTIEDPARFSQVTDVGAYLGLAPRRYQTGETSRTVGITKTGNQLTRTQLFNAATSFGRHAPDSALKQWFVALSARAGSKRARVALARKLAVILLAMWKNGTHFEPDLAVRQKDPNDRAAEMPSVD